jgi:hypothetical protein
MAVDAVAARILILGGVGAAVALGGITTAPPAAADSVAYLVNVTVRPGYNFPNADAALAYGYGVCDKIGRGENYSQLVAETTADFNTSDDYQGVYLINQAANELCPAMIWQLRQSAAHYTGSPGQ